MRKPEAPMVWDDTAQLNQLLCVPGKSIAIVMHVNPDGDALGSALALHAVLTRLGHRSEVLSPNDLPETLLWMPGTERIRIFSERDATTLQIIHSADLIFALDFNSLNRMKKLSDAYSLSKAFKVLIDHHPGIDMQANYTLTDTSASSTSELLYRFLKANNILHCVDCDVASCLFTGIMTDTGCFSYNSSSRATWETVAELLDFGIDKDHLYDLTYDNFSGSRMRLLGYCLHEKMEILNDFATGIISLSKKEMRSFSFKTGDSEGFVNYPLSVKGVRFSAFFVEKEDHIRISFRSKGNFAVNEFAQKYFNGGGHANASGGESFVSLNETVQRFKDLLPLYKSTLQNHED